MLVINANGISEMCQSSDARLITVYNNIVKNHFETYCIVIGLLRSLPYLQKYVMGGIGHYHRTDYYFCKYVVIRLFKMFSRWIWGIFNIHIQSDSGHKLILFMFQNKDKQLLGIYQYGCVQFCVSLLTDMHLKVRSNSILFTFSDKGALTSARDS